MMDSDENTFGGVVSTALKPLDEKIAGWDTLTREILWEALAMEAAVRWHACRQARIINQLQ